MLISGIDRLQFDSGSLMRSQYELLTSICSYVWDCTKKLRRNIFCATEDVCKGVGRNKKIKNSAVTIDFQVRFSDRCRRYVRKKNDCGQSSQSLLKESCIRFFVESSATVLDQGPEVLHSVLLRTENRSCHKKPLEHYEIILQRCSIC